MSTEQNIQPRLLEPGYNIIQGRGGQAFVLDVVGNMFLTSPNKPSEQQSELSIDKSVSSIAIMVNTGSIINTFKKYPSENFNTINQDQNIKENKVIIQSVQPTASSDLNVAVDVLPTSSVTSSVQTQVVEKPKSNKEIEVLFLPETEDIIFSPLYDENIVGVPLKLITSLISSFETLDNASPAENGSNNINGSYSTFTDNNPFNIINTNAQWKGKIGFKKASKSSLNFVVFDNIENGIRAALINLSGYFTQYKLNTVEKIINTYAPGGSPGQTTANTRLYIKNVTLYLQQNWNKNITSSTVLTFNGKNEINPNNIKMFKTLAKSILIIEGRANATPINFSTIDKFLIKNLN
jgi:hypothetical protein